MTNAKLTAIIAGLPLAAFALTSCAVSPGVDDDSRSGLVRAMETAQLILHEYSPNYECEYGGYEVVPGRFGDTYIVTLEKMSIACWEMIGAINASGHSQELDFVSVIPVNVIVPAQRDEVPRDLTLIHQIDPQ